MQPPQPPKPTRWQERSKEKSDTHGIAMVATLGQRTLAESRPTANQPGREPDGTPVPPAPKRVDAGAHLQSGIIDDGTAKGLTTQKKQPTPNHQGQCTDVGRGATSTTVTTIHQRAKGGCPGYRRAIRTCSRPPRCKETDAAKAQPTVELTVGTSPVISPILWTGTHSKHQAGLLERPLMPRGHANS